MAGAIAPAQAQTATYSEAPALAALVSGGELPPVAERLPKEPMVVTPTEIGVYGGTWRRTKTAQDWANLHRTIVYESLVRWNPEYTEVIPNVAKGWEFSKDSREVTFFLREGHKWSDGDDFNVDDIQFWYEAVASNVNLNPRGLSYMSRGGEMAKFERIDDYSFKFIFKEPAGLFLEQLAHPDSRGMTYFPEHYFKQFHPNYSADVDAKVAAAGVENWEQLFFQVAGGDLWNGNRFQPGVPALDPWVSVTPFSGNNTQLVMERNPYYFKVDPQGQQYPYIDSVNFSVIEDVQTMVLMAAAGDIDVQWRHINSPDNRAFFTDNAERGNYKLFQLVPTFNNEVVVHLNQTVDDPILRKAFQNKDFRIGLSHAINRQEIIDLLYFGLGQPHQAAPLPASPYYDEEFSKQYTEYDVELANQFLDKAGYSERNSQGQRVGSDGQPITIVIVYLTDLQWPTNGPQVSQMIADYWKAVGVNAVARGITSTAAGDLQSTNKLTALVWHGFGGIQPATEPTLYVPVNPPESRWGFGWAQWYDGGTHPASVEPTNEGLLRQFELYDQLLGTTDAENQKAIVKEILDIAKEEFWVMGITTPIPSYGIAKNNVGNVPDSIPLSWEYPTQAPTNPFTYFFRP